MKTTLTAVAACFAASVSAQADNLPTYYGDEIVVTPTRTDVPLADALQATTVITRAQIKASGAPDLPTLLAQQAGIEVAQNGGIGTTASVFMRGAGSNQVLILVNGVRVDSATTGATAIDQIMLSDVERIEIVRGNVSSVYGSSAMGGVIQIFTKRGRGPLAASVRVAAGGQVNRSASAGLGGDIGDHTHFYLSAAATRGGGFSAIRPQYVNVPDKYGSIPYPSADVDKDYYRNSTYDFHISHNWAKDQALGFTAWLSQGSVEYDGSFSNHDLHDLSALSLYSENRFSPIWTAKLTLSQGEDDLRSDLSGVSVGRVVTRNRTVIWDHTLDAGPGQALLGVSGLWQHVATDAAYVANQTPYARNRRNVASAYAGYHGAVGASLFQANVRMDDYSDFGSHTTGLLGYGYRFASHWRVRGNLSTAFRAPTFNDLYGVKYGGNPNLKPEQSKSGELGIVYDGNGLLLQATYFDTRYQNLIIYPPPTYAPANVGKALVRGLELIAQGHYAGLDWNAAYTQQNPVNEVNGTQLTHRAHSFGSLGVGQTLGKWNWNVDMRASGPTPDSDPVTSQPVTDPGYATFDLTGAYFVSPQLALRAKLINALNRDYTLVNGYNTQGRLFMLELDWHPPI